jgi:hypothetical protein
VEKFGFAKHKRLLLMLHPIPIKISSFFLSVIDGRKENNETDTFTFFSPNKSYFTTILNYDKTDWLVDVIHIEEKNTATPIHTGIFLVYVQFDELNKLLTICQPLTFKQKLEEWIAEEKTQLAKWFRKKNWS